MSDGTRDVKRWSPEARRDGPGGPAVRHKPAPRGSVVRPFAYGDGQAGEGTPHGREKTSARDQHYSHPAQQQHRRELGSQPPSKTK
jgi:hypothetical protein